MSDFDWEAVRDLAAYNQRERHHDANQQQEVSLQLPQCPYCGGRLEGQFELCMHCHNPLGWVGGVPCKPGDEAATAAWIRTENTRTRTAQRNRRSAGWKRFWICFGIWFIGIVGLAIWFSGLNGGEDFLMEALLPAFLLCTILGGVPLLILNRILAAIGIPSQ